MKKILIILTITFSTQAFSQKKIDTLYHFKLSDSKIIWQKIYNNADFYQLKKHLQQKEFTKPLTLIDSLFSGRSNNTKKRVVNSWPYFATFGFDGFVKVEYKNTRYRVTVSDIIFDGPTTNVYGVMQKQNYPLQLNVLKKGKINNNKRNHNTLRKMDSILDHTFTIKTIQKEDW